MAVVIQITTATNMGCYSQNHFLKNRNAVHRLVPILFWGGFLWERIASGEGHTKIGEHPYLSFVLFRIPCNPYHDIISL